MNNGNEELGIAAREAVKPGHVDPPVALLAQIAELENPLQTLQDPDGIQDLFAAFDKDFGFVRSSFSGHAHAAPISIPPTDRARYASLLRWLIGELRGWRAAEDESFEKIAAIFAAAHLCDLGNGLWPLLPDDIADNVELVEYLKSVVASFAARFEEVAALPPGSQAVEVFHRADAAGDWATVITWWPRYPQIWGGTLQIEAVRFLYRYCIDALLQNLMTIRRTPLAMQFAGLLTAGQRLRLALASDSPHMHLAAAYWSVTSERRRPDELSTQEQHLLIELLLKIASDNACWSAWMEVSNRHPNSYPALQRPLGYALAKAPESALQPYVSAIQLYPLPTWADRGPRTVAECLQGFSANASPERRAGLWRLAHQRWLAWNFNKMEPHHHATEISRSDLDYALVAYAIECMDHVTRDQMMQSIREKLAALQNRWHTSLTDMLNCRNRLLSQFQLYAHASFVTENGGDWLPGTKTYLPFEPLNEYLMLMYNQTPVQ